MIRLSSRLCGITIYINYTDLEKARDMVILFNRCNDMWHMEIVDDYD